MAGAVSPAPVPRGALLPQGAFCRQAGAVSPAQIDQTAKGRWNKKSGFSSGTEVIKMRAMFLKRNYIEKSKKSGRSMVVLDVFELPRVRDDGSGEMTQGQTRSFFLMDKSRFELGAGCRFGDIIDISFDYDERFNRGVPASVTVVQESPYEPSVMA